MKTEVPRLTVNVGPFFGMTFGAQCHQLGCDTAGTSDRSGPAKTSVLELVIDFLMPPKRVPQRSIVGGLSSPWGHVTPASLGLRQGAGYESK